MGFWAVFELHQFEPGQVLRIDQANRFQPGVDHDQIINVAFVEYPEGLDGQGSPRGREIGRRVITPERRRVNS
jgi:hypothetical protein